MKGLETVVEQAAKNGAIKCAPRELALARSHLEFASVDLSQGELSNAISHLEIAEPNAQAALAESPADKCSEPQLPRSSRAIATATASRTATTPADTAPRPGTATTTATASCPDDPGHPTTTRVTDSKDSCLISEGRGSSDGYLVERRLPRPRRRRRQASSALVDKCPNQPEDMDGWQDDDGCPDPDNDGDSVLDLDDMCPTSGPRRRSAPATRRRTSSSS